jgi:hypothetical protein
VRRWSERKLLNQRRLVLSGMHGHAVKQAKWYLRAATGPGGPALIRRRMGHESVAGAGSNHRLAAATPVHQRPESFTVRLGPFAKSINVHQAKFCS